MPNYKVVKNADGELQAHALSYELKEGETEVGTIGGKDVAQATKKAQKKGEEGFAEQGSEDEEGDESEEGEEEQPQGKRSLVASRQPSPQEVEKENERLKAEEEEKEEFTVMGDAKGNVYVEGDKGSDPAKQKKAKAGPEPLEEPEPGELLKVRAKDAKEAVARAKGEFREPAEGAPRGAQTP
jgi:hypothetical protein